MPPSLSRLPARPPARLLALLLLVTLALAGCTQYNKGAVYEYDYKNHRAKNKFHAELVAEDGTKIRFTVYQPGMPANSRRPLIIHAHGFGVTRMNGRMNVNAWYMPGGRMALEAWDRGYYVISLDERGHGASGGTIGHIHDGGAQDISAIIDWADKHLYISHRDGDPRVGMIGESYGGGMQLMASVYDKRIDAIVPIATWYDMSDALLPNGVAKSDWLLFLGSVGYAFNPLHMDGVQAGQMMREVLFDEAQPAMREELSQNSLSTHCSGDTMPHADALIISGFRDTVFPINHALKIRDCFQRAGRDARLIAVEYGHLAPTGQLSPRLPAWYMEDRVACGGRLLDFRDIGLAWFDAKLRDRAGALDAMVPKFCFTGDNKVDEAGAPPPGVEVQVPPTAIGTGASGLFEWVAAPAQAAANVFVVDRTPDDWMALQKDGGLRPGQVPLLRASAPTWVAGVPTASLDITDTDRPDATVFLRLAAWKPGDGSYRVLSDQVTPVRGAGHHEIELAGVRAQLQADEILGLLVQGYSNQYRLTGSGFGTDARVSGTLRLPVAGSAGNDWLDVPGGRLALAEAQRLAAEADARVAEAARTRAEAEAQVAAARAAAREAKAPRAEAAAPQPAPADAVSTTATAVPPPGPVAPLLEPQPAATSP